MLRQFVQKILTDLARRLVERNKPIVIAVTGTVGKTSAKEAIAAVLASKYSIRTSKKNFNNEWGVPFTILGVSGGEGSIFGWLLTVINAWWNAMFASQYPEVLVLEFGIDKPGDMQYLTGIVKLDFAVVTMLGEIPVHVENFSGKEALWQEKLAIARGLKDDGVLFYNTDDPELGDRAPRAISRCISFGTFASANIKASGAQMLTNEQGLPMGLSFSVESHEGTFAVSAPQLAGLHQLTSLLAAASIGIALGVPVEKMQNVFSKFNAPNGRLKLLGGVRNTFIFDDTYNASPQSTAAALAVLSACEPRRRIAVLGDMLELGELTEEAHRTIGIAAVHTCDVLITVGARAKFIADEALQNGLTKEYVHEFEDSTEAAKPVELLLREGDAVLVKGSQGMRMEKIVEEIMAEPERKKGLLVRQEKNWQ